MPIDDDSDFEDGSEVEKPTITPHKPTATQETDEDEQFDLDDLLPSIGEFGKYQKLLVFGICLPACIPCGFCAFNQLFMADTPTDYWCRVPELLNISSVEQRKQLALPPDMDHHTGEHSKCYRYAVNWLQLLENTTINDLKPDPSWPIEKCREGWEYDTTEVWSSIVIDVWKAPSLNN